MKALGISEAKNLAKMDTLQAYYTIAGRDLEREIVLCSRTREPVCWSGARWLGVFSPANIRARTRSPRFTPLLV